MLNPGPDHVGTMSIRFHLAHWRGEAGEAAAAAAVFEELLADYLRVLGADHPATLATRRDLGGYGWRRQAGRYGVRARLRDRPYAKAR